MTKLEFLEMDRDTILDHIDLINMAIYDNQVAIERLEKQIKDLE